MSGDGLRYNGGKLRYDLMEPFAMKELATVFTRGAQKYAPRNWEKGMKWSDVLASLERHIADFKAGIDRDAETNCLHMAHVAWNALALTSYYKLYPQGDDRPIYYLNRPKFALDIDEVLADWIGAYCEYYQVCDRPTSWYFSYDFEKEYAALQSDFAFWQKIQPKILPADIPGEPTCYVTNRPIPVEWTQKWLSDKGFPTAPVISVPHGASKSEILKGFGVEIFVDDRFENFVEINKAGIACYLMDAPHNQRYQVGARRIHALNEILPLS